ncbi:MAG: restriction endonuclease subunit S [Anaerolineaceae bacterium]|nr:MAG: restriction endonuclease subunit S [Anaerolineaceae bacterium]
MVIGETVNLTPIRELVQKTRHLDPKKLGVDSFAYVDISSVDKDTKRITEPQMLLVGDAPSRARKEIKANDVLVATVRPNLNGVAIVPAQYDNQIASTGFCVLRSDVEQLDPNYLFYFTQTDYFISHLTELSTGAGYPAVSDEDILDTRIPLPPLTEQKRIASLLARADRLRHLRRTAHDLSDSVLQSVFLEMFGGPKTNSKKWDVEVIGEFVKPTKQMNPQLLGRSDFRYVDITSIDRQSKTVVEPKLLSIEDAPSRARKHISANDILVSTVRPNLNAVAKVPKHLDNQIASTGFCVLRPDTKNLTSEYLFAIVQSKYFVDHLVKNETGANYPAVSDGIILDTPIPVPPLSKQEEFAGVVARVESLRGRMSEGERQVEGLFESLLVESFGG